MQRVQTEIAAPPPPAAAPAACTHKLSMHMKDSSTPLALQTDSLADAHVFIVLKPYRSAAHIIMRTNKGPSSAFTGGIGSALQSNRLVWT